MKTVKAWEAYAIFHPNGDMVVASLGATVTGARNRFIRFWGSYNEWEEAEMIGFTCRRVIVKEA